MAKMSMQKKAKAALVVASVGSTAPHVAAKYGAISNPGTVIKEEYFDDATCSAGQLKNTVMNTVECHKNGNQYYRKTCDITTGKVYDLLYDDMNCTENERIDTSETRDLYNCSNGVKIIETCMTPLVTEATNPGYAYQEEIYDSKNGKCDGAIKETKDMTFGNCVKQDLAWPTEWWVESCDVTTGEFFTHKYTDPACREGKTFIGGRAGGRSGHLPETGFGTECQNHVLRDNQDLKYKCVAGTKPAALATEAANPGGHYEELSYADDGCAGTETKTAREFTNCVKQGDNEYWKESCDLDTDTFFVHKFTDAACTNGKTLIEGNLERNGGTCDDVFKTKLKCKAGAKPGSTGAGAGNGAGAGAAKPATITVTESQQGVCDLIHSVLKGFTQEKRGEELPKMLEATPDPVTNKVMTMDEYKACEGSDAENVSLPPPASTSDSQNRAGILSAMGAAFAWMLF